MIKIIFEDYFKLPESEQKKEEDLNSKIRRTAWEILSPDLNITDVENLF